VLPFEEGQRVLGAGVVVAYYAQYVLDLLKQENTVLEELARSAPNQLEQNLRRILGGFLFSGDDVRKRSQYYPAAKRRASPSPKY